MSSFARSSQKKSKFGDIHFDRYNPLFHGQSILTRDTSDELIHAGFIVPRENVYFLDPTHFKSFPQGIVERVLERDK